MDEEVELRRLQFVLIAFVAVVITGYISWGELRYKILGRSAEATVTQSREEQRRSRHGRRYRILVVEYTFSEADGTRRNDRDEVSPGTPVSRPTTRGQYLPGVAHSSRLTGQENVFAVLIFVGSLAWMGYSIFRIAREANAPIKTSRRK